MQAKTHNCQICKHPERTRIESLRASGVSIDVLAKKFKVHRDAVWRHYKSHVSADSKLNYLAGPATINELRDQAQKEGGSLLDYLITLRSLLMGAIVANAEAGSGITLGVLSGRLVEVLKEIGRLTGEIERLDSGVTVTNNIAIMASEPMVELQSGLMRLARLHPGARSDIVRLLRSLDAPAPKAPPMIEARADA